MGRKPESSGFCSYKYIYPARHPQLELKCPQCRALPTGCREATQGAPSSPFWSLKTFSLHVLTVICGAQPWPCWNHDSENNGHVGLGGKGTLPLGKVEGWFGHGRSSSICLASLTQVLMGELYSGLCCHKGDNKFLYPSVFFIIFS